MNMESPTSRKQREKWGTLITFVSKIYSAPRRSGPAADDHTPSSSRDDHENPLSVRTIGGGSLLRCRNRVRDRACHSEGNLRKPRTGWSCSCLGNKRASKRSND